jgi:hypothetical protein
MQSSLASSHFLLSTVFSDTLNLSSSTTHTHTQQEVTWHFCILVF